MIPNISERKGLTLSFNTTEDCNLACKYCYEINKRRKTLDIETAKKFIDVILESDDPCGLRKSEFVSADWIYDKVTLDLIGGDALMKPKLCNDILSYFFKKVNSTNTPLAKKWRKDWKCSISTNGTLFSNPEVRAFCEDWKEVLSVGVSIDGCPTLHDLNRPFIDGRGSFDVILKNWDWYRKTFPVNSKTTKATLARNSIPYIAESLKFMHEDMGIIYITQNFIMEDTHCQRDDYLKLIVEMNKCIDYILDHDDEMYWMIFEKERCAKHHKPELDEDWYTKGACGSGVMPALSISGNIYPCFRWLPHTNETGKPNELCVGNIQDGLNHIENFIRVQTESARGNCTKDKRCWECEYENACAYCIGGCYAEFGEFRRTTYICTLTKIMCEAAAKYWELYNKKHGLPVDTTISPSKLPDTIEGL